MSEIVARDAAEWAARLEANHENESEVWLETREYRPIDAAAQPKR